MIFFLNLYRLRESQKLQFDKKCCTRYIRKLYIHAAIYDDQTLILFVFYYRHIFLPTFRNKSQSLVNKIKTYVLMSQKSFSCLFLQITKKSESFKYNTIHWLNARWVTHCVIAKMHALPQFNKSGI